MTALLRRFVRDEGAATAIEYGLIVALIAAVLVSVLTNIGTAISSKLNTIVANLQTP